MSNYVETGVLVKAPRMKYVAVKREYPDKTLFGVFTDQEDYADRNANNNRFGIKGNWMQWFKSLRTYREVAIVSEELDKLNKAVCFRSAEKDPHKRLKQGVTALLEADFDTPCLDEYIDTEYRELKQMILAAYPEIEGKFLEYRGGWLLLKRS